jgi:hypothetical protein
METKNMDCINYEEHFPNLVRFNVFAIAIFMLLGFKFTSCDLFDIQRITPIHSKILSYQKTTMKHATPKCTDKY